MAGPTEKLASETIWSNGKVIIPMCDVQHIERRDRKEWDSLPVTTDSKMNVVRKGIVVVMKSTRLDSAGDWDNGVWLWDDASDKFIADYCTFRGEIDPGQSAPIDRSNWHVKYSNPVSKCEACSQLLELYEMAGNVHEHREYWLMTELFLKLHGGSDTCPGVGGSMTQDLRKEVETGS